MKTVQCFVCDRHVPYETDRHHAREIHDWKSVMVCDGCSARNWDGVVPSQRLAVKFAEIGVTPTLNEKSYIVIPPRHRRA